MIFRQLIVFFLFCFISVSFNVEGQIFKDRNSIEIFDASDKVIYTINIQNKVVNEIHFSQGKTSAISQTLVLEKVEFEELPSVFLSNTFKRKKDLYWITIRGTNQVYEFDAKNYRLTRLDHSYFRGYNFEAIQFIHQDTLFSFGGMGFWHSHNVPTFFDTHIFEWELYPINKNVPLRFTSRLGGYAKAKRELYAVQMPELYENQELNPSYLYVYHFDTKHWKQLGKINKLPSTFWQHNRLVTNWVEPFFISEEVEDILIEPFENKLYKLSDEHKFFLHGSMSVYSDGKQLYNIKRRDRLNDTYQVDSIAIDTIKKGAKSIGSFYEPTPFWEDWNFSIILTSLGAILVIISFLLILKNRKRIKLLEQLNQNPIPEFYKEFMDFMLKKEDHICSTNDLNDIIKVSEKPLDTQRQYRSRFISQVNHYIHLTYGVSEGIERASSSTDKRFVYYKMSVDLLKKLNRI